MNAKKNMSKILRRKPNNSSTKVMKFTPYSLTAKGIKVNIELYLLSTLCGIKRQKKKEFEKGRLFCWNA